MQVTAFERYIPLRPSIIVMLGELHLSGSTIQKSEYFFMKEWRTIKQKRRFFNHSNE